ncbi:hypothetical protein ACS15_1261 [Ralstonia insidiosa]|uniref:DUF3077 domain-containing protein n=1 Tax=Ralstonia insidiosa TaxID=190721 RepID=A0AAC9BIE9_9RALS|nr:MULTISPECIES: hypothetical protein [Ralstonia]ANH73225.1 hypothetical protein ACS15_1261 [Ralstonia insidiosa]EPX97789.1 hypothetical protein C404_12120 [Ralstonia sp. AU12-08]
MSKVIALTEQTNKNDGASVGLLSVHNTPVITDGMAAISMMIADAVSQDDCDRETIADAALLLAELAQLVQRVIHAEVCHA